MVLRYARATRPAIADMSLTIRPSEIHSGPPLPVVPSKPGVGSGSELRGQLGP
jgi:hypothetical protein